MKFSIKDFSSKCDQIRSFNQQIFFKSFVWRFDLMEILDQQAGCGYCSRFVIKL